MPDLSAHCATVVYLTEGGITPAELQAICEELQRWDVHAGLPAARITEIRMTEHALTLQIYGRDLNRKRVTDAE
jgi:hypothetical protein